jgi:hypothetical protein
MSFYIFPNGNGLAMWWNLKIVRPERQHNKNTKAEANKQSRTELHPPKLLLIAQRCRS